MSDAPAKSKSEPASRVFECTDIKIRLTKNEILRHHEVQRCTEVVYEASGQCLAINQQIRKLTEELKSLREQADAAKKRLEHADETKADWIAKLQAKGTDIQFFRFRDTWTDGCDFCRNRPVFTVFYHDMNGIAYDACMPCFVYSYGKQALFQAYTYVDQSDAPLVGKQFVEAARSYFVNMSRD